MILMMTAVAPVVGKAPMTTILATRSWTLLQTVLSSHYKYVDGYTIQQLLGARALGMVDEADSILYFVMNHLTAYNLWFFIHATIMQHQLHKTLSHTISVCLCYCFDLLEIYTCDYGQQ
jgi:hypothetical protein